MEIPIFHSELVKKENGNRYIIYPTNTPSDVVLKGVNNEKLPAGLVTLEDLVNRLDSGAFNVAGSGSVGLSNVTNDKQIKAIIGSTENHVLIFGADGSTVKDSGYMINSTIPENAKFTDTTYENATADIAGIVKLSDTLNSTSSQTAASSAAVKSVNDKITGIKTGIENGTISVNNVDVNVAGLGSAAYADSSTFATSAQGLQAQNSVQDIKIGKVLECESSEQADITTATNVDPVTKDKVITVNFSLPKGAPGTMWYFGTAITGTNKIPTIYTNTNIIKVNKNDIYLNIKTGLMYLCVLGGNNETAQWQYMSDIKGEGTFAIGSSWFAGSTITGESTEPFIPEISDVDVADVGDFYFNVLTETFYRCVKAGVPAVALWKFVKNSKQVNHIPLLDVDRADNGLYFLKI